MKHLNIKVTVTNGFVDHTRGFGPKRQVLEALHHLMQQVSADDRFDDPDVFDTDLGLILRGNRTISSINFIDLENPPIT